MRTALRRVQLIAAVVALCGLLSAPGMASLAAEQQAESPPSDVTYSSFVSVQPGALSGKVFHTDARTPAAEVPVCVWSVEGEQFVHEGATDKDGAYQVQGLRPGRYLIVFGDRVFVDLRVDEESSRAGLPLNVIVPRGEAAFAQMPLDQRAATLTILGAAEGGKTIAGMPLRTVLIVGGAALTAVGIIIAINNIDGDDDTTIIVVSP